MQGKVLHEGLIRLTSAHNDPHNPSSRYQITHSAVILARLQIKLAHQAIGENYAAYKLCDANGRELNGSSLQEVMQEKSGEMLKLDARRVMNPVERGMLSCSYHLTLHSEHSSEPMFFQFPIV